MINWMELIAEMSKQYSLPWYQLMKVALSEQGGRKEEATATKNNQNIRDRDLWVEFESSSTHVIGISGQK